MHNQRADYGLGQHELDIGLVSPEEIAHKLSETFSSPHYRPPMLPAVALEVHQLSRNPDAGIVEVCAVLERDPMLSAGVLRLSQAGSNASREPIRSLNQAAARIGLNGVRDFVFQVALESKVFRTRHYQPAMESIRVHSLAVAKIARRVMEQTSHSSEYAFLAGLLHDVGLAAGAIVLSEWKGRGEGIDLDFAAPALELVHEEASATLAKQWKLPPELVWILGAHQSGQIDGYAHPVACAIVVAEHILDTLDTAKVVFGNSVIEGPRPAALERAREALGFDDAQLERLLRAAAAELEAA